MMQLICRETAYAYDAYHILRAFFPEEEVSQKIETEQEPLISVEAESGSYFRCGSDKRRIRIVDEGEFQQKKDIILRFYQELVENTGRELPWGILTGVRPTKLLMGRARQGDTPEEMIRWFRENYRVSEEKAALGTEIVEREREILRPLDLQNGYSLYAGIPFCPSICAYCSFSSSPIELWKDRTDAYLEALSKELLFLAEACKDKVLNTVYIGGGTPTTLTVDQLDRLLTLLEERFDYGKVLEVTVEAGRPDSITEEKLLALKRHHVTRISINPQTMQQKTLDRVGRRHTVEDVRKAFQLARELGFDNINMDLIAGLPGEGIPEMQDTLAQIEALGPDSLTVHALAVKRAAFYGQNPVKMASAGEMEGMIGNVQTSAERMGLHPYYLYRQKNMAGNFENVGYAKVDKAGIYNILIMEEIQTILAAGAGSSTKIVLPKPIQKPDGKTTNLIRIENVKNVQEYIERIDEMTNRKGKWLWH